MSAIADNALEPGRQESNHRILDAAEALFRHYGYAKTTVADIAKDLGMSPANIYRFFASKAEIHQALCARMLQQSLTIAEDAAKMPASAEERLRHYSLAHFKFTVDMMLVEQRVHEMVLVAIEREWNVIDEFIDKIQDVVATIIADGMEKGEFRKGDADAAARAFGAATIALHHPQLVAQCVGKPNRVTPEELTDFAIKALKV
ncbi:TetR family transcriptional regulator [Rhizobium sp. G187]|uniref:TetR/AcrR family transcriptional regulator n=1 Tax=unclassified Rhizobium TaxID=2613769 RepID=UPI0006B8EBB4|nr:TetR/AcrR family transcriptional regulator [Rhizobium sp. AAP43]KPF45870.1 TetR family transcriptional regulator [Rhizobium sp. AAP43]